MRSPLSVPVVAVIGTRPEAIKMAPVLRALAARGLQCTLVCTGQHPSLDVAGAGIEQGIDAWLALDVADATPDTMCDRIETLVRGWLVGSQARLVVVQGDTSSALGAARAAHGLGLTVAHVEAGLRTFDPADPWPEERNRVEIDGMADLLFAPTGAACANLGHEGVRGRVYLSGNSGIDAVLGAAARATRVPRSSGRRMILVTAHRRENRGAGIAAVGAALRRIGDDGQTDIVILLHPNLDTRAEMVAATKGGQGIVLLEPQSFVATVELMLACDLVLTDSGGLQEEAPALGRPVLILRASTERREAIDAGSAVLVGTDPDRIVAETLRLLGDARARARMSIPAFPFGSGGASTIIADAIVAFLDGGSQHAPPAAQPRASPHRT